MELFNLTDGVNAFEVILLQSEEYADTIIRLFKEIYVFGDPNDVLSSIVDNLGIKSGDLLDISIQRVHDEVENYLRSL